MRIVMACAIALGSIVGISEVEASSRQPCKYKVSSETLLNFKDDQKTFAIEVVDQPLEAMRSIGHYAYSFHAKGAPVDQEFLLVNMPLSGIVGDVQKIAFDKDGSVYLVEDAERSLYVTSPTDTAPGQEFQVFVVNMQGEAVSRVAFTPFPWVITNEAGYKLTFKIVNPILSIYKVKAEGFNPNEKVKHFARSGEEVITKEIEFDASGVATIVLKPAVGDKLGGWSDLTLEGSKGKIAIRHPWGLTFAPWAKKMVIRAEENLLGSSAKR